jgi:hypothetical protein
MADNSFYRNRFRICRCGMTTKQGIQEAETNSLKLQETKTVKTSVSLVDLLQNETPSDIWLVEDDAYPAHQLVGVLAPFDML